MCDESVVECHSWMCLFEFYYINVMLKILAPIVWFTELKFVTEIKMWITKMFVDCHRHTWQHQKNNSFHFCLFVSVWNPIFREFVKLKNIKSNRNPNLVIRHLWKQASQPHLPFFCKALHHLGTSSEFYELSVSVCVSRQQGDVRVVHNGQCFISSGWTRQTSAWCTPSMRQLRRQTQVNTHSCYGTVAG